MEKKKEKQDLTIHIRNGAIEMQFQENIKQMKEMKAKKNAEIAAKIKKIEAEKEKK